MRRFIVIPVALFAIASVYSLSLCGCNEGSAADLASRPDLITIDGGVPPGELERSLTQFPHDLHTEAIKDQGKDCTACHPLQENGRLSLLFMRVENTGGRGIEELYHENCIGCHNDNAAANRKTGPVACGDCHRNDPLYVSSWHPSVFDNSLHYRHTRAEGEQCNTCHHTFDDNAARLARIERGESPCCGGCRDCHTEDSEFSFSHVAHSSCIDCHREIATERPADQTGPQSCGGCHDQQRQIAIEVVEQTPRLPCNQPDFAFLSAPRTELESSRLNTVPFSHVGHERFTTTCRVCHHETLAGCSECHDLRGAKKGGGVTLEQAMHSVTSDHSCVGCHREQQSAVECAGCHDLMEQGRVSEHACGICHAGPPPEELEDEWADYRSLDQFRPGQGEVTLSFEANEIPETVTIGVLADKFPPVEMPHGMIVETLRGHIKNNRIAAHFHGHEDVVCQGCHHNGSIGRKPALCENCHREPFNQNDLFRPGLNGAYHRQCLGCHVSMDLQEASDCAVCHETQRKTSVGMTSHRDR